jgi:hypothetical protein
MDSHTIKLVLTTNAPFAVVATAAGAAAYSAGKRAKRKNAAKSDGDKK